VTTTAAFPAGGAPPAAAPGPGAGPGVLMVVGAYYPELSGASLQCRALVLEVRHAVRITILSTTTERSLPAVDTVDGVPVFRVFVDPNRASSKLTAGWRMARVLLRERRSFSILHLHGFSQKSVLLVVLGLLMRARVAFKMTSVGHDDPVSMKARGRLAFWSYSRAHVFFGVSPRFQALYAESGLPERRFRLIPNGVDLARFKPASPDERRALRRELDLPADAVVVLFVGFFSHEKCPTELFDPWARMAARAIAHSVLVFVGRTRSAYYEVDPGLAVDIRARAVHAGLGAQIRFVEETREIEKYHRSADIFAMPSVREGLPNSLLEAMACGTACVVTRLEGVTDTLIDDGENGILIPPRDVAALESALVAFASNPDRARAMGERARERIARDFDLKSTALAYLQAYQELVAS
jgi:glycosyltransferase involved in cell wall biosynthesis